MELADIRSIRKKLGLTQSQLAKHAGVSQSLIAKVEAGKLDPTYTNAQKIFSALHGLTHRQERSAEQMMRRKIVSVSPKESIREAITTMRKQGFSQLPVLKSHQAIGLITEATLLNALLEGKAGKVEEVMEPAPPVVDAGSKLSAVSGLLLYFPLVLVSRKGEMVGILTKTDLLLALNQK